MRKRIGRSDSFGNGSRFTPMQGPTGSWRAVFVRNVSAIEEPKTERASAPKRADMNRFQERRAPLLLFFFARVGCALLCVTCGLRCCLVKAGKAGNPVNVAWLICNAVEYPLPPARFFFLMGSM